MIPFEIRPSRIGDAESMIALLNPLIEEGKFTMMDELLTIESQLEWITHIHEFGLEYVAETASGQIIGMQSVEPSNEDPLVGEISTFVHSEFRGSGIGKELSAIVIPNAKTHGFRMLLATVRMDNLRAVSYYESIGFQKSDVWNKAGTVGDARPLVHLVHIL